MKGADLEKQLDRVVTKVLDNFDLENNVFGINILSSEFASTGSPPKGACYEA